MSTKNAVFRQESVKYAQFFKVNKSYIFLLFASIYASNSVFAQSCGGGIPSANNPFCVPPPSSPNSPYYQESNQYQQMPSQVLEPPKPRKWGSIAVDPAKQVAGFSKGMETDSRAEKAAIKDCKSRGGKSCKLETTYSNQCVGMVVGKNSVFRTARAETEGKALHFAMTICEYESGVKCQIYYAGCSFADRVN